ncbi:MAG: aminotransferase class III-fold pyridoxal phosphate-dependent enzyme [Desulfobacteraceae bacterium]|nr:aminotransferase class III-fold pyridoxal phosphate-dependent enzyme [Desulfobacteraceae bacterium]
MNGLKSEIIEKNRQFVCPEKIRVFNDIGINLVIGKREGPYIYDIDGKKLIDLHINGGTYNLGHRAPEIIKALNEALEMGLDIGNHHFPSSQRGLLAEQLVELTPGDMKSVVFASGGSESVDVAIKSARHATNRRKIVSIDHGFHGRTGLSGSVGDTKNAQFFLSDAPDVSVGVPFNDLNKMENALKANDTAAVIIETIPATLGFPLPERNYLSDVKLLCEKYGALYIADEIQTGLGRSGKLWAIEHYGVNPDILVTAKGLSGGIYPIAATVLNKQAGAWLYEDGFAHISTFGGSEIGCYVGRKVLDIVSDPKLLRNVDIVSAYLLKRLQDLQKKYPYLLEIRQKGFISGLKFDGEIAGIEMLKALYDNGIWVMVSGYDFSVIQFKPYIYTDKPLVDDIIEIMEKSIIQCQ